MKKYIINIVIGVALIGLIWGATQQVISMMAGIGSVIPPRMVNQEGYVNHLRGTITTIDSWNPSRPRKLTTFEERLNDVEYRTNWIAQRYMEETEFKIRYVDVFQNILRKLAKVSLVEES